MYIYHFTASLRNVYCAEESDLKLYLSPTHSRASLGPSHHHSTPKC